MNPLFRIDFSISDSLKIVRKSVLIYETIIKLPSATTPMEPGLDICLRDYKIRVTEATPPGLLSTVLRVIRDAE